MNISALIEREQILEIAERLNALKLNVNLQSSLSVIDNEGNIWITPDDLWPQRLQGNDILFFTDEESEKEIAKKKPDSSYLALHRAIYQKNLNVRAIIQVNSPTITAIGDELSYAMLNLMPYHTFGIGTISIEQSPDFNKAGFIKSIADLNEEEPATVLLRNFGMIAASNSLENALLQIERIEHIAKASRKARTLTEIKSYSLDTIEKVDQALPKEFVGLRGRKPSIDFTPFYRDLIDLTQTAFFNEWITFYGGSFSVRVDELTFFMTSQATSRNQSVQSDFSIFKGGKVDSSKSPDRTVNIHQEIYFQNKQVNCIAFIEPDSLISAILSGQKPEYTKPNNSYKFNNKVEILPFESLADPEKIANAISLRQDGILIENFMYLCVDKTVENLVNRLFSLVSLSRL